jgi:hypothetical protein
MGDPRELEWAKKPNALKEGWMARTGTHMVHGMSPYTDHVMIVSCSRVVCTFFFSFSFPLILRLRLHARYAWTI